MTKYSYSEILKYFAEKLGAVVPTDLTSSFNLEIDHQLLKIQSILSGGIEIHYCLGLILHPVRLKKLEELNHSNYLGCGTGGCTLCFDETGTSIYLKTATSGSFTPEESWEWLHRTLNVGRQWQIFFSNWEEFVSLSSEGFS